ncbi:general transcription factor 3C polypeptide 1 [Fopius arisanus]|uniref:General transcription factor 3C polypeptide 1 n=1 Tax=Fopius arisanus TaxID=64838 RepID=A0A9R1TRA8_9HYME|nr:PREDICTED: general transcription factor 3C polypeptide 1 [Fopius arisanus]
MPSPMMTMIYSPSTNLVDTVIDEVALEGLDGITLEALWQRLALRLQIPHPLPTPLREQVWSICISTKDLLFYELESPRGPLVIYDRYEFVDPDLGTILEPEDLPDDIYEHYPIDDIKTGVRGSCKSYHTRKLIDSIRTISLASAEEKFGQNLVIVGAQPTRQNALMGDTASPTLELTIVQYCFLERVGRSRYHGEVTQGKRSLSILGEESKSLFYHRKFLSKHKMITKQTHYQKSASAGHGSSGTLVHLPRFFVERKPKMIYLAESIVEILRTRDNYIADYSEIKKKLQLDRTIKNLFKLAIFQKIVRTDLLVPYRTLYPHADISEWQRKAMPLEKKIKAIQLLDPNIDVNELWNKDDLEEEESPQVYDLDISKQKINEPLLTQANLHVESANCDGLSQTELGKCMGLTKLQARTILRNLAKMNIVGTYMNDVGRQRMTKYVSKRFEKNSAISKQFKTEMIKMKALTKPQTLQNHPPSVPSPPVSIDPPPEAPNPEPVDERMETMERMEIDEQLPSPKTSKENLRVLFTSANRILNKYKLYKLHKYQLTCQDLSGEHSKHLHSRTRKLSDQMKKISLPPAKRRKIDSTKFSESDTCEISLQEIKIPVNPRARLRSLLKELHSDNPRTTGNITYRILKRANMIIESVKEHKVIDDTTRLMRMINEEEEREGYDVKIDKKSLIRLLQKLAGDNLVKHINLTLTSKGRKKMITFICDPSIDVNHTVIQSAVEQAKIKFCVMRCPRSKANHSQADNEKITQKPLKKKSKQDMDPLEVPADIKYDPKAGKRYGYSPKFVRMQVIHLLLYHVIYDYPEPSVLSQEEEINRLRASGYQIDSKMEKEMGRIYDNEVSWKMFIPPLAPHEGWPRGWALMCDILHRMPLSIFLKFCKIPYEMADLNYYLDDPIRKHTLIKELPTLLRNALLQNRKYIYSFHETISRLCFIGLVQFGPQKLKHKDQVFLYLNRRSELYDTTTSAPSYHKISEDSYPRYSYYFDKAETVEKYWYDMWSFCINTHLGGRLVVLGTDIVLEELTKKPEMMETLKPRSPEEAKLLDIGILPGDKRGAAGIDSAFFAHLKRNWNWDNFQRKDSLPKDNIPEKTPVQTTKRNMHLSKIEAKPLKFTDFRGLKKSGPTNLDVNELKVPKNQKASLFITSDKHLRHKILTSKMSKQNAIVRRVLPKKQVKKSSTKVKYDDIDYSALQKMQKLRVDWDPREDNILLVCKVVMTYLCPNPRRQLINCTAVRDVLRSYSSSSHNKTSRACQRRLLYMLKKPQTMQSVGLGVEEIKQNYYVHKRYDNIVDKIRQEHPNDSESKIVEVFKTLVSYVAKKYYDISESGTKEVEHMPKTIQEFNLFYHVTHPQRPHAHLGFTQNVKSVNDIHTATINSVIYSSMCCGKDRRSWAYQLFRIYQQYSEILLKNAMGKIRADHMVCVKKHYLNAIKKFGNCMPMSSSQYQLSTGYIYKFQTKISPEVYDDVFEFLKTVVKGYRENTLGEAGGVECVPPTGGMVMGIPEYFIEGKIDFNVEIPDHVIMLDPKLQEYDETYIRIVKRYQDILTSLEQSDLQSVEPSIPRIHSATSMQKAEDSPDWERIKIDVETAPAKSTRKVGPMKTHWTHKELRKPSREDSSTDYDSNIEEGKSDLDDDVDNDYIKLQDGTIIPITKGDIEIAKSTPVDDHVHQAFLKTRKEAVEDVSAFSVIDQLKEIVTGETTKMCVDPPEKRAKRRQERDTFEDNSNFPPKSPTSKTPKYLNDVIAKMDYRKDSKFAQNQRDKSSGNTGSPHTGLALLTMREELNEDVPDSHHAHEYFVVNSFGIYYSFPHLRVKTEEQSESCESLIKSGGLLVVEDSVYKKVLADLRKFAVFPKEFPEYDRITELLMIKGIEKADVDVVYEYVESKQEQGATLEELVENFHRKLQVHLYEILSFLTDYRLLLRSGVTRMHYIHHKFVDPWLIQSIRIMRLQKESLPPVPPGTVYVLNPDSEAVTASEPSESPGCKKNPSTQVSPILSTSEHQKNLPKKRTCLLQTKDIYNAAKKLDMNSAEDINVVVRPWIQIDGLVNRKGLEQMLGAVLGHCLMHPGIMLPRVQERFIPALQPYHTRELVEILVKLGCLGIKVLQKGPVNLFSQSTSTILTQPIQGHGESEYDNEMIIEPTIGAVIKFSSFIRKNRDQL